MSKRAFGVLGMAAVLSTAMLALTGCSSDESSNLTAPESPAAVPAIILGGPDGVHHRATNSGDDVRWNAPAGTVMGYNVYMYDPAPERPEAFRKVNGAPIAVQRYVANGLEVGSTYHFAVRAINADDVEGEWSETVSFEATGPQTTDGRGGGLPGAEPDPYEPGGDQH